MKSELTIKTIYVLLFVLFFFLPVVYSAPGDLDPTFSQDGKLLDKFRGSVYKDSVKGIVIQPDGKIVVTGGSRDGYDEACGIMRLNADGSPDTTFGDGGKLLIDIDDYWVCKALVLQPDGKLVITGEADDEDNDFVVVRLNPDGTFDKTFNGTGKKITSFSPDDDFVNSIVLQPDGKILVAGEGQ